MQPEPIGQQFPKGEEGDVMGISFLFANLVKFEYFVIIYCQEKSLVKHSLLRDNQDLTEGA